MKNREAIIEKLNEILKWEWAGVVQYTQSSFVVQDVWREVFSEMFRENGEEALHHAHQIGDKIVALGGVPTIERGEVKQSTDLHEMLQYAYEIESRHVQLYTEALAMVDEREVGLRVLLEDICKDEQDGADHMAKLLKKQELAIGGMKNKGARAKVG